LDNVHRRVGFRMSPRSSDANDSAGGMGESKSEFSRPVRIFFPSVLCACVQTESVRARTSESKCKFSRPVHICFSSGVVCMCVRQRAHAHERARANANSVVRYILLIQ